MSDTESQRLAAAWAIRELREHIRWRPGQDEEHLAKRKALGQLPEEATLGGYDALIRTLASADDSATYHYPHGRQAYYAVAGSVGASTWLVVFGTDGAPSTAFPPYDVGQYLERCGFVLLGTVREVLGG